MRVFVSVCAYVCVFVCVCVYVCVFVCLCVYVCRCISHSNATVDAQ